MKALSVKEPWAGKIRSGEKSIETRTWYTSYRGPLLICASKVPETPLSGMAVAVAVLVDCRQMTVDDERAAGCGIYPRAQAWVLENIQAIVPFPVRGMQRLFNVETKGRIIMADETAVEDTQYGLIDENTPIGRTIEFEDGEQVWEFLSLDDGVVTLHLNGAAPETITLTLAEWNERAQEATGYTDPQDDTPPEQAEPDQPGDLPEDVVLAYQAYAGREVQFQDANDTAKAYKKAMEAAQEELNDLLRQHVQGMGPLFAGDGSKAADEPASEDAWRRHLLKNLTDPAIPEGTLKALAKHEPPIITMGDVSDWVRDKGDFWAKNIKGIGEAAQGKIADATAAYWEQNPQPEPKEPTEEPAGEQTEGPDETEEPLL